MLSLTTNITSIKSLSEIPENEQALFKGTVSDDIHVIETEETIFYPQGGGQPSDVGTFRGSDGEVVFEVIIVRNAPDKGRILHFGRYEKAEARFKEGEEVSFLPGIHVSCFVFYATMLKHTSSQIKQDIDAEKRLLYSRIHTAGHVLGLAVGELKDLIPDVVDTKAQHYPDAAYVEFRGSIDGKHKDAIQVFILFVVIRRLF